MTIIIIIIEIVSLYGSFKKKKKKEKKDRIHKEFPREIVGKAYQIRLRISQHGIRFKHNQIDASVDGWRIWNHEFR